MARDHADHARIRQSIATPVQLGDSHGVPLSSHLFPEISVHLLAATPTAHWLEYVDWAEPVLETPVTIKEARPRQSRATWRQRLPDCRS